MENKIKVIECPRDAMQGIHHFIPTEIKAAYINALLKVGFHTIDAGSFVSPKAIPQLRDTADVFRQLDLSSSTSKLLAIVANTRGGEDAVLFDEVSYIGYPFSISETFQLRNTNATIEQSLTTVDQLQELALEHNKDLVIYISMAFGNPYGDEWNPGIAMQWVDKIAALGIKTIALADTVGIASPETVGEMFRNVIPAFPAIEIGAHLHCTPGNWRSKLDAAYTNGCRRFDTAIRGFGGCPMAKDELVGNMATENLVQYFEEKKEDLDLNNDQFNNCLSQAMAVFNPVSAA